MAWIIPVCGAMLLISALLVLFRIAKGPTTLDRMVSVDVMTSIMLGALALMAASTRRADLLVIFVVVSIVGFLGSVSIARATRTDKPEMRRILSLEEDKALAAAEESEEDSDDAIHDVDVETPPDFHVGTLKNAEAYSNVAIWREMPVMATSDSQSDTEIPGGEGDDAPNAAPLEPEASRQESPTSEGEATDPEPKKGEA